MKKNVISFSFFDKILRRFEELIVLLAVRLLTGSLAKSIIPGEEIKRTNFRRISCKYAKYHK